jgi:surface antigen
MKERITGRKQARLGPEKTQLIYDTGFTIFNTPEITHAKAGTGVRPPGRKGACAWVEQIMNNNQ